MLSFFLARNSARTFLFFYALAKCRGLSMLLFCLPRKVTKRVHSRTTFLRISLTCRFKRAAARVRVGMLLHLTWYALQIERWSRSTLSTWLYSGLGRVRHVSYFAQILAVRIIWGANLCFVQPSYAAIYSPPRLPELKCVKLWVGQTRLSGVSVGAAAPGALLVTFLANEK